MVVMCAAFTVIEPIQVGDLLVEDVPELVGGVVHDEEAAQGRDALTPTAEGLGHIGGGQERLQATEVTEHRPVP